MRRTSVLFVCIHNSARSQMGQGWLRHLAGDRYEAESAGLEPGRLNPFAVKAMEERGVDISGHRPKGVDEIVASGRHFEYVIAVCDKEAAERCPLIPGEGNRLHWNFPDPSAVVGSDEEKLLKARQVCELIRAKMTEWIGQQEIVL